MFYLKLLIAQVFKYVRRGRFIRPKLKPGICFVVARQNKGWILDAFAKEIKKRAQSVIHIHYGVKDIPSYETIIFMHFSLVILAMITNRALAYSEKVVFFTHYDFTNSYKKLILILNSVEKVICMNSHSVETLKAIGVSSKLSYCIGAADKQKYTKKGRKKSGKILLSAAYYERKSPERILRLIRSAPELEFILLGKNWEKYSEYQKLKSLPNLEVIQVPYERYGEVYEQCSVFLSLSMLEGGPIPLIEGMMSNLFPVVTRVGFCGDVICHGFNGFLIEEWNTDEDVIKFLKRAYGMETDVSETVKGLDWQTYTEEFLKNVNDSI